MCLKCKIHRREDLFSSKDSGHPNEKGKPAMNTNHRSCRTNSGFTRPTTIFHQTAKFTMIFKDGKRWKERMAQDAERSLQENDTASFFDFYFSRFFQSIFFIRIAD